VHHELDPIHARTHAMPLDDQLGTNFFERIRVPVKIPLREPRTYAPYMTVRVFAADDMQVRTDRLIGFASVPLIYDIPWAKAGVRPRLSAVELEQYEQVREAQAAEARAAELAAAAPAEPGAGAGVGVGAAAPGVPHPVRPPLSLHGRTRSDTRGGQVSGEPVLPGAGAAGEPAHTAVGAPGDDIAVDVRVLNEQLEREWGAMQFRKEKAAAKSGDRELETGERTLGEAPATKVEGDDDDEDGPAGGKDVRLSGSESEYEGRRG
jgi:hypothetical protein